MATIGDISTKISNLTTTDTNQYPLSDRLIDINLHLQKVVTMILDSEDEMDFDDARYTDYPSVTIPLTTNRDYAFGQVLTNNAGLSYSILKVKNVSVSYDGTNFYKAFPLDLNDYEFGNAPSMTTSTQNTTIDGEFSRTVPRYDFKNNSLFLYPMATSADVANGAKMVIEWYRTPVEFTLAELTAGTVIPGFDASFHMMLAYGAAYEFCAAKGLPQADRLYREYQDFEIRLRRQYSTKQSDRKYQLISDYQSMK